MYPFIECVSPESYAEHAFAWTERRVSVFQLSSLVYIVICVGAELCVHPEVFQIGVGDHLADDAGKTADAELESGTVWDVRHYVFRDLYFCFGGFFEVHLEQRAVLAFDHHIDF